VGTTQYQFIVYNRSSAGTETNLFYGHAITEEINELASTEYLLSYARRNYTTFFPGDQMVIKVNASTTSVTARDAWITLAGNTRASMVEVGWWICEDCCSATTTTAAPYQWHPEINPTTDRKLVWTPGGILYYLFGWS
jgi:hypothetical protein